MTLKRLMIILGILVVLAGGGIAWLWQYAYSPQGRARGICDVRAFRLRAVLEADAGQHGGVVEETGRLAVSLFLQNPEFVVAYARFSGFTLLVLPFSQGREAFLVRSVVLATKRYLQREAFIERRP